MNSLENFVHGDTPSLSGMRDFLREVFAAGERFDLSLYECAGRHDIRQVVLQTLLTYLELDGYLEAGTPFYSRYQFVPLASSAAILARFEGERRKFLSQLFQHATKAAKWFTLDLEQAARATGADRERVVRALDYLSQQLLLELKVEGLRHRFRQLRAPSDVDRLAADLHQRTLQREARGMARLGEVLSLATHNGCQTARLAEHFGDPPRQPCGHCGWCQRGRKPAALLPRASAPIDEKRWQQAKALAARHTRALAEPRALARFLCGISSPRASAARLSSDPLFGSLAHVPFVEVLRRAERR